MLIHPGERHLVKLKDGMLAIVASPDPPYPSVYLDFTREGWDYAQTIALVEENPNGIKQYIDVHCWLDSDGDPHTTHIKKERLVEPR